MQTSTLAERIQLILKEKGIRKNNFDEVIGINGRRTPSLIEGRSDLPRLDYIIAIHRTFPEYLYEWLIDGTGPMRRTDETDRIMHHEEPAQYAQEPEPQQHDYEQDYGMVAELQEGYNYLKFEIDRMKERLDKVEYRVFRG